MSYLDCQEIIPNVFLGPVDAAIDKENLSRKQIGYILTVAKEFKPKFAKEFEYLQIDVLDEDNCNLICYFEKCHAFIDKAIKASSSVLVHCRAGVSRSACIVISYLMVKLNMSVYEAYDAVKKSRPCVSPNIGFLKQLLLFNEMGLKLEGTSLAHQVYKNLIAESPQGKIVVPFDLIKPNAETKKSNSDSPNNNSLHKELLLLNQ